MNILTVGGEGDKIPEHFLADGISCAHVASSRAALEAVRMRPGLFDIIVIGSSITDTAGGEDRECFLTICRINSKILIAICTGKNIYRWICVQYRVFSHFLLRLTPILSGV